MITIFWNKKLGSYFIVSEGNEPINCCKCKKAIGIERRLFIHRSFSKINYTKNIYCLDCIKDHKLRVYDEFINAEVIAIPPKGSSIVPEYKPGLKIRGDATVFELNKLTEGETVDGCKVSYDPRRNIMEGSLEHKKKVLNRIENLDQEASMDDLNEILDAEVVALPQKKKKRISNDPTNKPKGIS
jgi:hypothetical protein